MSVTVDERGRVLIPKGLRDAYGFTPGRAVIIASTPRGIEVRAALDAKEAADLLAGAIPKTAKGEKLNPLDLKRLWEPKL